MLYKQQSKKSKLTAFIGLPWFIKCQLAQVLKLHVSNFLIFHIHLICECKHMTDCQIYADVGLCQFPLFLRKLVERLILVCISRLVV